MTSTSKTTFGDELRALQSGIHSVLAPGENLLLVGTTYTPLQLSAKIDAYLAAHAKTSDAKAAFHAAVTDEQESNLEARVLRGQIEAYVITRYGKSSPILVKFGFKPAKTTKASSAVKAVAVLKLRATRAARGTTSKKEKAKVTGQVDPGILKTLTATAAAAAPAQPAVTAPPEASGTGGASSPVAASPAAGHAAGTAVKGQ